MAELSHRKRVPGVRLVWLFRVAPTPVQRALVAYAHAERARREGEVTRPPVVDQRASGSRASLPAAIGWLTVAPPAVSAVARVARLDESSTLLILADGLTALLVPPALLALGIGLRQRSRALTVLSAATAAVLLWTTIPAIGLPDRAPPPAGTSPAFRLFNANLHAANPDVASIAEEIRAAAPDLVALQEVDQDAAAGLMRSGVLARFPYRVTEIRNGPPGIALWSRFPLADPEVLDTGGMPASGPRSSSAPAGCGSTTSTWSPRSGRTALGGRQSSAGSRRNSGASVDRWWSPATSTPPATIPASGGSCGTGWRTPTSAAGADGRRPGRGTDGRCHR